MTRIAILKTGAPPPALIEAHGDYPAMFGTLLGEGFQTTVFDVQQGEWPDPVAFDGAIVTGSAAGVYESDPWIGQLLDWLRAAKGRTRLVGVCFGHQAMAQAFGGQVIKSPKGWAIGEQGYRIVRRESWMDDAVHIRLPGSHQDQVVGLPPSAEVIAASDFTPLGALAYRDQSAISMQLHPEFEPAYAKALIEARRGKVYSDAEADAAIASYAGVDDRARVGRWINSFLTA
jgi:GMP synthase-like glutamine amidotransferase